jgi:tetratricopeptide (TPR) repeat protein
MASLERISQRSQEQTRRWCRLSSKLGRTCVFDPLSLADDPSIFVRAEAVARGLGDLNVLARAKYWLAYICYSLGRFRESLRHAREALELAQQAGDQRLAAQIEAMLGQVLAATCDYPQAIKLIDSAMDTKRRRGRSRGDGPAIGSAYTLACKGGILADQGDFPAAHACFDEAIGLLEGSTHPVGNSVRNWIAVAYNWQGNWSEAKRIAADSLRIAENTRALLLLSAAGSSFGYAEWASERSAAGLEQLGEAMHWMDERRGRFYTSIYFGWLVAASVAEGRMDAARGHAGKVLQRARRGERLGEAVACRGLAWIAIRKTDAVSAERWMRRAEVAAARRQSPREAALNQWMRGQIQIAAGRADRARPAYDDAIAGFERMAMRWHAQRAQRQLEVRTVEQPVLT